MRVLVLAILLPAPALAITGSVTGSCPGPADIEVFDATPGEQVAILLGAGVGRDVVPAGPCAGVGTDLSGVRLLRTARADGAGQVSLSPTLPPGACSRVIQFLDLSTCELSDAFELSDLDGGGAPGLCDVDAVLFGVNDREPLDDGWSSSGGHHFAYTFVADADMVVDGAQLNTGESTAPATLGIWSDSAGEPDVRLGGGGWTMLDENQWQGPSFDAPVLLAEGETYWLMMYSDVGYQTSRASSGVSVSYKWSTDLFVWNGPFMNTDIFRLVDCR
ncbi:MAG: hypothetical protein ACI8PZ_005652 [Myxococcota bacterium]|jgi:hypothetical protein